MSLRKSNTLSPATTAGTPAGLNDADATTNGGLHNSLGKEQIVVNRGSESFHGQDVLHLPAGHTERLAHKLGSRSHIDLGNEHSLTFTIEHNFITVTHNHNK